MGKKQEDQNTKLQEKATLHHPEDGGSVMMQGCFSSTGNEKLVRDHRKMDGTKSWKVLEEKSVPGCKTLDIEMKVRHPAGQPNLRTNVLTITNQSDKLERFCRRLPAVMAPKTLKKHTHHTPDGFCINHVYI
ncbi:hypothetical protein GOODEAATRI_012756 [Goodea atripinnis]|uniref:Uncharacterized protein n=1 Tax=Goodea atripinnis TaxID=208336 RepID=A0ABV0MRK3_9TELE